MFYEWLNLILHLDKDIGRFSGFLLCPFLIMGFLDFQDVTLFPCSDPRERKFPAGSIPKPNSNPLLQHSLEGNLRIMIKEGHYMLFLYGNAIFIT